MRMLPDRGLLLGIVLVLLIRVPVSLKAAQMADSTIEGRILSILSGYGQDPTNWGVQVRSLERGDNLVSLNTRRLFMPASNLKLIVTAAALDGLGPDFRYKTTVMADGEIITADSLLKGSLIVRGSGDPTISDRFYPSVTTVWEQLACQVARAGIRRITGSLVVDNTLFEAPFLAKGWGWEDLMWWYAAPVSALAYNDNCIDVEIFPAPRVGEPPEMRIKPKGSRIQLINQALTVESRQDDHLIFSRNTPGDGIALKGGIYKGSLGFLEHVAVDSPAKFAGNAFADALASLGVRIDGPITVLEALSDSADYLDRSPLILAQHVSVPLSEIVHVINKRSHNFYAEQLLFTLGAYLGKKGSFAEGIEVEKRFLQKIGLDTRELSLEDGSGLSRLNLVTPGTFVTLLAYMDSHPAREEFFSSLKVGGKDNGLQSMHNTQAEGNIYAKTGYISSVMGLSGYARTADGEPVAFSILGNNWLISRSAASRLIRDVCVAIAEFSRRSLP
ncbi:MAG TPA: D-alanyl-D-alanine carboxypeptidase/D-alanyl-D-alanine-endopeptidase [archaeon]|nr:D-alanyl-D-alanine carboxypeptidase/D-alanyl-D-alanine-endopeptidase [archaeon]